MSTATSPTTVLDTLTAIETRRSVKHYDPGFVIPEAEVQRLLEVTLLSPTSFNIQNWRFVRVRDKAQREAIKTAAWGQAQVTEASELFILCGDLNAWGKEPERYWRNAPQPVQDYLVPAIKQFYQNNPQAQRDEAMRSCGLAGQTLMLAAKAMGYDSCPMIGFDPVEVGRLIQLPEDHIIGLMIVVGKALQPARERGGQLAIDEVVFTDTF